MLFENVNMTSYFNVTNSVYPITMTTIGPSHCLILEFGKGTSNQAVVPGITGPLHATAMAIKLLHAYLKRCDGRKPQSQHVGGETGQNTSTNSAKDSKIHFTRRRIMF